MRLRPRLPDDRIKAAFRAKNQHTRVSHFKVLKRTSPSSRCCCDVLTNTAENNATLTTLFLGNNNIGDEGVRAFAAALDNNATLTRLDLDGNNIGARTADTCSPHSLVTSCTEPPDASEQPPRAPRRLAASSCRLAGVRAPWRPT